MTFKSEKVRMNRSSAGRLLQARGTATAKTRSPMVAQRVAGNSTMMMTVFPNCCFYYY